MEEKGVRVINQQYHNSEEPFNDAVGHMKNHQGLSARSGGKLPRPIRIIGYILFSGLGIIFIFAMIVSLMYN
ncbi:hypothetical protein SAMN04487944_11542 [Gracilibacillus ureilyticus]|uniref:Uncharacterized protein n=1 Tax=Gracilibacillus ureilyticus TaxID=531814 RepID=A0A1H9TY21_9BACI|nr:hypothetical protein SAMN04487944_11542 [Gracilibacillus ureilyticus]